MSAAPLTLKANGPDVSVSCIGVVAVSSADSQLVSLGTQGVQLFKNLAPNAPGVTLGSETIPFERLYIRSVKGDVVFDGKVTFNGDVAFANPPWPAPPAASVSTTTTMTTKLVGANTGTNPVYIPVQTMNESTASNALTQWVMANDSVTMGLRLVQNGRTANGLPGGSNAAFIHNATGDLYVGGASNTRAMTFFGTGPLANAVCIGVTPENAPALITMERANLSSYKLIVNGVAWSTSWRTVSDRNAKENVEKITDALAKVRSLNGYTYNLRGEPEERRMAGVMAQDVERVLPEAVDRFADGAYALDYNGVLSLLLEAVKELDDRMHLKTIS